MLERINADLNNFVNASSYDLLAPLSRMEGMINLLDTTMDTQDADREIIQMIKVSILKFKEMIQELAEVGKVQAEMLASVIQALVLQKTIKKKSFRHSLLPGKEDCMERKVAGWGFPLPRRSQNCIRERSA